MVMSEHTWKQELLRGTFSWKGGWEVNVGADARLETRGTRVWGVHTRGMSVRESSDWGEGGQEAGSSSSWQGTGGRGR